ncbi:hypothetical protein AB0F15_22720 [Amycolatopsis sp. NPDC026612]|uniref:hypothetical protein n=1 Tax=Amycolatopsis sp. NPDC026612 TaxID=3155466 RepID=UPI0033CF0E14
MINRRSLLIAAAGAGTLLLVPGVPAFAEDKRPTADPGAIGTHRIEGSSASVAVRSGAAAIVLLHIARRWHYEIGPLGTGEGTVSSFPSGTAIALYPNAYPAGGTERLRPHEELIVRDILADCAGIVTWGGDLDPAAPSHFRLAVGPADAALAHVAGRLDPNRPPEHRSQLPGMVADPADPARRALVQQVRRR